MEKDVTAIKRKNYELNEALVLMRQELDQKNKNNDELIRVLRELEQDLEAFQIEMKQSMNDSKK